VAACRRCGKPAGILQTLCADCIIAAQDQAHPDAKLTDEAKAVQLTTAQTLAGHRIVRSIGIVTGENAFGFGLMGGLATGLTEAFGGESATTQSALANARESVLQRLQLAAARVGGNAVVAVDLDYSEFSGIGKPIIFIVANGTAVVVEAET